MKKNILVKIALFNQRIDALYNQVCGWLEEEKIEFDKKVNGLTLNEALSGPYETKRLEKDGIGWMNELSGKDHFLQKMYSWHYWRESIEFEYHNRYSSGSFLEETT